MDEEQQEYELNHLLAGGFLGSQQAIGLLQEFR
jgi:hypothetical protein